MTNCMGRLITDRTDLTPEEMFALPPCPEPAVESIPNVPEPGDVLHLCVKHVTRRNARLDETRREFDEHQRQFEERVVGRLMERARLAYEAYAAATGGLTYDGRQMPKFEELPERIAMAWASAAVAASKIERPADL